MAGCSPCRLRKTFISTNGQHQRGEIFPDESDDLVSAGVSSGEVVWLERGAAPCKGFLPLSFCLYLPPLALLESSDQIDQSPSHILTLISNLLTDLSPTTPSSSSSSSSSSPPSDIPIYSPSFLHSLHTAKKVLNEWAERDPNEAVISVIKEQERGREGEAGEG
eukprot:CAMPEP_0201516364 /NCGR_PEP_ID=MMETSP0161_2-20130828/7711_1 /ASSEMBLY_ACC=CAM_ASM_000251 /TAXON_ID=180227 /ORGANISM="Neoparamoeba aestuarina, Strain SoJaBio B1-5/56/2" /LENGTH=163 /DNA_ID=CAMNT_0047913465 /DNA_START=84 /DNA_END=572 /DNA_ORIENTATION=+